MLASLNTTTLLATRATAAGEEVLPQVRRKRPWSPSKIFCILVNSVLYIKSYIINIFSIRARNQQKCEHGILRMYTVVWC